MNKALLRGKIAAAGYTQAKLADAIGISKNTLSAKISGKTAFNTVEIQKICDFLGIYSGAEKAKIFLSYSSQNRDE